MLWDFVVCLLIFTKYFKVCSASNAFLSKAHSFTLQSPTGSPGSHGMGTSSRAQRSTPAADTAWFPLLSLPPLRPPVSLNVAMSASSHWLVNINSDLLLPLAQAVICGSDLTWMIKSYTSQMVDQPWYIKTEGLPSKWIISNIQSRYICSLKCRWIIFMGK